MKFNWSQVDKYAIDGVLSEGTYEVTYKKSTKDQKFSIELETKEIDIKSLRKAFHWILNMIDCDDGIRTVCFLQDQYFELCDGEGHTLYFRSMTSILKQKEQHREHSDCMSALAGVAYIGKVMKTG